MGKNKALFIGLSLASSLALAVGEASSVRVELPSDPVVQNKFADRTYKGELSFSLQGKRFDDEVVNSRYARLFVVLDLEARYRDWLKGNLQVIQMMTSGQASNLYSVTEGGTGSGTLIGEASVSVMPLKDFKASAGILEVHLNPVFSQFMSQANAGASLEAAYKTETGGISAFASQTIPTSKATSNRITDEDVLPLLTIGTLSMDLDLQRSRTKLKAALTRFIFTDLSSQAAADSQQTGSTTIGNGKGGYLFVYDYRGNEVAVGFDQKVFTDDEFRLKLSTIRNELAPEGKNSGWQGKLEYNKAIGNWRLIPSIVRFRMESDALPSSYSLLNVGFSNRDGTGYGLRAEFPKQKFTVFGGYTQSNVIDFNSTSGLVQADRVIYTLGVEANYDIF